MDNESRNWFRFAKCLVDAGNSVLQKYIYFHVNTCSLSDYHNIWQKKVKDRCRSDDLKVLWTSLNQHVLALDVTSQQIIKPLLSKWKCIIGSLPMEIRHQLSVLESWRTDLQDTIYKTTIQQDVLKTFSNEIQKHVSEHSSMLSIQRNWTKDFIDLCHANQLTLLKLVEQYNEKTSSLLSAFLQQLDVILIHGAGDLENALKTYQQHEGNSFKELQTNLQTSFISWQSKIDKFIDSFATNIPNCINKKILQNLLTDIKNDLPGIHNTCQVNVNDICSAWHNNLQKKLAKWNKMLQQAGKSAENIQHLAQKWHARLQAFPSASEFQIKDFFDSKSADLQILKARRTLTEPQWVLIFPSKGIIKLQEFDITLSCTLLRNVCSVYPPESDWSGEILDTDHSMGADLMRLKNYRNDYVGHIARLALPNADFEKMWSNLETIFHRLSVPLGDKFRQEIQQTVTELRTCSFDDRAEIKLQLELINWYKSDSGRIEETLELFLRQLQALNETIKDLPQQQVELMSEIHHLRAQIGNMSTEETTRHLERIEKRVTRIEEYMSNQKVNRTKQNQRKALIKGMIWQHREDKKDVHVHTRAYDHAKATLLKQRHLVLHGKPGDGKTHTALSLIADLMQIIPEMQPVKVNNPTEWEELVDMKQPLIVFMDDVLGKYGVSDTDLVQWEKLSELINANINDSSIFLIVCFRYQILLKVRSSLHRNEAFSWMFNSNVINISNERYSLTNEEKTEMLVKYAAKYLKETDDYAIDSVVKMSNVIGFPQNCKIWSCTRSFALNEVFTNNIFLVDEIKQISRKHQQNYFFLVLLMLFGGSLYLENNTEDLRCTIKKISELCDVREHLTISQCKEIGHSLCGTFVEFVTETKIFRFQHDSIESAVFFSFGNDYPEITLELCSLQALTKMCCLRDQGNLTGDESFLTFKIIIDNDTHVKVLVDRFLKSLDSKNKELFQCIAEALVWQSRRFSTYFLKSLTSEDDVINFLSKKDLDEQSLLPYFIYAENTLIVNGIVDKISQFNIREHHAISRQILLATVSACLADRADICNYLIEFKVQVDDFVMFAAASTGNTSIMDKLLRHGGNINATISDLAKKDLENTIKNCVSYPNNESYHHGINLLHIACNYGRTDMVMYLKTKCLELLHKTSNFEFTAAHFVARSDNVDLMKLLLTEELDLERRNKSNCTVLHIAAANGNVEMVKYIIDMFPDMANQTSTDGWTVLHSTGRGGSVHVLNILLDKGLDIMAKSDDRQNVLHISVEYNHLLMVKHLIEKRPELIKEKDKIGQTALHYAAKVGSVSLIDTLLLVGSDITARRNDGSDVLQLAVLANNLSTTEYLIKTFPQLKHTFNNNGCTVLHYCSQGGSIPAIEILLQEGIDLNARTKQGNNALHIAALNRNLPIVNYLIKECPKLVQQINNKGFTALHAAAQGGDIKVIKALIKAGSNITENNDGTNVLHTAVANKSLSAVKYLIDKYPLLVQLNNRVGWTPLHTACEHSGVPMVEALMQVEVDITARTKQRETILHLATIHNNLSVVKYIVEHFPQLKHEIDFQMRTAIHCAAQEGNVPILEALLQAGLNITAMTNDGSNVLHIAAAHDKVSVVIYLVQTYSKVIRQLAQINNKSGWKPIHNAAKHGSVCLMEVLVQAGADITAKTEGGLSVVQIAEMENDLSMVIYLIETFPYLIP